jgi:hypothetical protein
MKGKVMQVVRRAILLSFALFVSHLSNDVTAQDASSLPLADTQVLTYDGAFQISSATFGDSRLDYAEGPIAYNPIGDSLFVVGHAHHQAIAEFAVPELVKSNELSELNTVSVPIQSFSKILNRAASGNTQNMDRVGGLMLINDELFISTYEYYDADANATHTTLVIREPKKLSSSDVDGFYSLSPRAHASKWMSPIPQEWRTSLGGEFIAGSSSGGPIISRHSVGPSAFVFDPVEMTAGSSANEIISAATLLDFSLSKPLHDDLSNETGNNDLWTHLSYAVYGFIIPGSRTYLTIGYSGGHDSGVGYKITQDNGRLCGGYCSRESSDNHNYYWMWDLNDLTKVKNGKMQSHTVRPYAFGELNMPFQQSRLHKISGASFDIASRKLYISLDGAGSGERSPVIAVFSVNSTNADRH